MSLTFRLLRPLLFAFDPETAHMVTIRALTMGLAGRVKRDENTVLSQTVAGLTFPNPVGLAAGFDKNAEVPDAMLDLGFGFVEVGTVTPRPQTGNPKPRIFRLPEDRAVINRLGFNNQGLDAIEKRLRAYTARKGIVGANLGANKDTVDKAADYVAGLHRLYTLADYFTINISSPNTPNLRALQHGDELSDLLSRLVAARSALVDDGQPRKPLFLKIAPDLTEPEAESIAQIGTAADIDAVIISNTTIDRPYTLMNDYRSEAGGLSGRPLFQPSTELLARFYKLTNGTMPLIGVGGIASGLDAYRKILAGASLVQLYSALIYQGPGLVARINKDLIAYLRSDGFQSVQDAVGQGST